MPHIAEGLLHAHLDGGLGPDEQLQWTAAERHLEICSDCRERLEEARELRARARDLLREAATPVRSAPGFEALAAEAEVRRTAGNGGSAPWWRSTMRLAWAASLVMAAGAGWLGHELLMEQGGAPPVAVSEPPASEGLADAPAAAAEEQRTDGDAAGGRERSEDVAAARQAPRRVTEDAAVPTPEPEAAAGEAEAEEPEAVPEAARAAPEAADDRRDEFRISGQALKAPDEGPRCFRAAEVDAPTGLSEPVEALRLDSDGTVRLGTGAGTLVGFWEPPSVDSLSVRVTDGSDWIEFRLSEVEDGLSGTAAGSGAISFRSTDCPSP